MSCGQQELGTGDTPPAESSMPRKRTVRRSDKSKCGRCREERSMYLVRSIAYCKQCFLSNFTNRFMRQLYPPLHDAGPSKIKYGLSRPRQVPGSVLVPVSGGAGSMAMLDILRRRDYVGYGQGAVADKTAGEKEAIWDQGTMLYVEFAAVTGGPDRMGEMRELAASKTMRFVGVRAEEVYTELSGGDLHYGAREADGSCPQPNTSGDDLQSTPSARALKAFLSELAPASRPAVLEQILQHIIHRTALSDPTISHILVGETSTRESERVISGTALGRGWSLPLELSPAMALRGPQGRTLQRIKPMKGVTVREAAVYCHLNGIKTLNARFWAPPRNAAKAAASLESLTEMFIARLDTTHPSTVSTINKTGDKLRFTGDSNAEARCPFCDAPAQPSALAWKSRTALTALSESLAPAETPVPPRDGDPLEDAGPETIAGLAEYLCYACLTTFTPETGRKGSRHDGAAASGTAPLPDFVRSAYERRRDLELRDQIKDFLLEDAGDMDSHGA